MSSTLAEIRGAIVGHQSQGNTVYAVVMNLATALDLSSQMIGRSFHTVYGVAIVLNQAIPDGEWVISSQSIWEDPT